MIQVRAVETPRFRYLARMTERDWQFWIDRGGTFTDVVARRPDGALETAKLLSDNRRHYADAAAEGIRRVLERWQVNGGEDCPIAAVKMGTTVATNALLERRGTPTALLVTAGFEDALAIGYQNRPDIFALEIVKPSPIYATVAGLPERMSAGGDVLKALDEDACRETLGKLADDGIRSVAICLLHGFRYPDHENRVAELARDAGFAQVSVSHEVEALIRFVSRAETALADAYLTPVLKRYIDGLQKALADVREPRRLLFMQSGGGLAEAGRFRGKDSILSGPAGGVVGMVEAARAAGLERLVGFDMGGTSTDVSAWAGEYERSNDSEIAGVKLRAPMMRIHTIAAGGGSVLHYADERYQVGPDSAGADPGPCCYRQGGPLAVTDANLLLGRIPVEEFPAVFGPGGDEPLDVETVRERFAALAKEIGQERGDEPRPEDVAAGFLTVAVESMANAIRKITIERGEDVRDFTLCCFGGAGGQHACRIADTLGMKRIWLHPFAGVLSAYGMGLADVRVERQASVEQPLAEAGEEIEATVKRLVAECEQELERQQVADESPKLHVSLGLRVPGSDTTLDVDYGEAADMVAAFDAAYEARFGAERGGGRLIVALARAALTAREHRQAETQAPQGEPAGPVRRARLWNGDGWDEVPVYRRDDLSAATTIEGPAIVAEDHGTTVVDAGWRAALNEHGHLLLTPTTERPQADASGAGTEASPDPVRLEVFNRLFMNIAEQMGTVLRSTALSVNIRERLDFSCALFDGEGQLVSNAPHMPVHLGSMGESVRAVIEARGDTLEEGDAVMLNSPYAGGTHLPDITVVSPWFGGADRPRFFVASRAHHADVGGITPGSMPARSRHIDEEGVLLEDVTLVRGGRLDEAEVRKLFETAPHPARNVDQNLADLKAQLAANRQGMRQLEKAVDRYGLDTVLAYLRFVRENATVSVRRLLDRLKDGRFEYELDSGETIRVAVTIDRDRREATVDFTGTSPQADSNFNAPEAVTRAAVLYVFRSLIAEEIPMNEGCLVPLTIRIPKDSLLSPSWPAAVVAGNVETSQCVTDTLFGALNALAASQGTMNNLSFGNARFQYYETIAGGAGAGPDFDGADAVQTHMTNSRLTDTEVLESTYPVLVERFAIRRGSGGNGRSHGGDGIVREIRFEEAAEVTILSNHRRIAPFGLAGGDAGSPGRNTVNQLDGSEKTLPATATVSLEAGDSIRIETPGGGGFGKAGKQ